MPLQSGMQETAQVRLCGFDAFGYKVGKIISGDSKRHSAEAALNQIKDVCHWQNLCRAVWLNNQGRVELCDIGTTGSFENFYQS